MARYSRDHKQTSREEIVKQAAGRFRSDGMAAVGMRSLMADVGLTHGAFYAHFSSRADLEQAAVEHAIRSTLVYLQAAVDNAKPDRRFDALVRGYLHLEHRARADLGCATAALAPELARSKDSARERYAAECRAIIDLIAGVLPTGGAENERLARAYAIFAGMMGTLQLMRIAVNPGEVSFIMDAGREAALALGKRPWSDTTAGPPGAECRWPHTEV